jgi:DNA modification methylase
VRTEEKTKELFKEILDRFSNVNDKVLDCFAGTASCALACLEMDRKFTGCEKYEDCYTLAVMRLFEEYKMLYEQSNINFINFNR